MTLGKNREACVLEYQKLRGAVQAAFDQATQAIMFHETWRPAAKDVELHARMGTSYATHSFQIARWALRRELILALMRIWDHNSSSLSMRRVGTFLKDADFFVVLVEERAQGLGCSDEYQIGLVRKILEEERSLALPLIEKYLPGGQGFHTFKNLRILRDQRLAHHKINGAASLVDPTDDGIEQFYRDTLDLVSHLLHVVNGVACDVGESASMFAFYAQYFWAGVRGERTDGHPDYRSPSLPGPFGDPIATSD